MKVNDKTYTATWESGKLEIRGNDGKVCLILEVGPTILNTKEENMIIEAIAEKIKSK